MFTDKTTITVKSGDGGNGCCSFRREKYVPKGGPDGGDGGDGGNVILVASPNEQNLNSFVYRNRYAAKNGPNGLGADKHGRNAEDVLVPVPVGTLVFDADSGDLIVDMAVAGQQETVAIGGRGGRGNARFASSRNRAPRYRELGHPGEEKMLTLELKTIADVGLVGYPNAGKSTLLTKLTPAHPKVAPYPFTTLQPCVGIIEYDDYARISVADIPGLIDGAHENIGLGHEFLRHIERTTMLLYVLDMGGVDGRTPWDDFRHLQQELELYQPGLTSRRSVVIANKMDLPQAADNLERLKQEIAGKSEIIPITAGTGETGILKEYLRKQILSK